MELTSYTSFDLIVYVEWESRVNFVTIIGDLYQTKFWGMCNNLKQFTHLSSAPGSVDDFIKNRLSATYAYIYIYILVIRFKALVMWECLLESIFCLYFIDLVSSDTTMTFFFFF